MHPETPFFLFGMGDREKFMYKSGALYSLPEHKLVFDAGTVRDEQILPDQYTVILDNGRVVIREDAHGVHLNDRCLSASALTLPDFSNNQHPELLRILHHEILINIIDGKPLPNFFVYGKSWYRDSAMMAMALQLTSNIHLLKPWIMSLDQMYDRNNGGIEESDNIGQALYLISTVSDASHPLVAPLIAEARRRCVDGVIEGMTDFGRHPVYQTKWLKFGLDSLGIDSAWARIPRVSDSYASLFWMAYRDEHSDDSDKDAAMHELYPYLWWAKEHFYEHQLIPDTLQIRYPLTWECQASQANYNGIRPLSENYANAKFSAPHTWHAAEMFLRLIERKA